MFWCGKTGKSCVKIFKNSPPWNNISATRRWVNDDGNKMLAFQFWMSCTLEFSQPTGKEASTLMAHVWKDEWAFSGAGLWVCQADCSYGPRCYLNPSEGSALPLKLWEIRPLEQGELTPGVQKTQVLSAGWWREVLWMGGRLQSKEIFIHSALLKV